MFLSGLGTATPATRYTQAQCWDALVESEHLSTLNSRSQAILRKVLRGNNGICSRHLAFEHLSEAFALDPDVLDARFAKHAPAVAAQAAARALADARTTSRDIDAAIISTCTGYLCPGLTSYVSERLGLRNDILALDLVGQGCGAALPNMRTGEALIASGRAGRVLSICVEICSAAMYLDNDPGVLISACLFGDGAGAAVLTAEPIQGRRRIEWKWAGTLLNPADRDELRFEKRHGMLRNILSPAVPALAAKHVDAVLNERLHQEGLTRADISTWILHAGGREILSAIRQQLELSEDDTRWSAAILRDYGNVSSPCVYFVLQAALADRAPGGRWWMSSFGAGFTCHGALLEVD
ncbi:MAG TPA: 3-oxoacyl-[acyl-carrier-protein] synthase III C-terminal domain-containing protein [Vicinamibacterales bacterium]|nr:3-oxoacyl-[acyl-carrier-protein] synthase III C-terminal domain-containing protein [Vicinamibacterales bacterium]